MESTSYTFGLSPCPNDSFISYGFSTRKTSFPCSINIYLRDVQELNEGVLQEKYPISKISLAVYPKIREKYILLDSGGALGEGCGPLIVATQQGLQKPASARKIAIPGIDTTANALLKLYEKRHGILGEEHIPLQFDAIIPALQENSIDMGVLIHESRFEYARYGLSLVADLGFFWESEYKVPIPLGGIVLHRDLSSLQYPVEEGLRKSLAYSYAHYEEALQYCSSLAQELNEETLKAHIAMFVNEHTESFGEAGMRAIQQLWNVLEGRE